MVTKNLDAIWKVLQSYRDLTGMQDAMGIHFPKIETYIKELEARNTELEVALNKIKAIKIIVLEPPNA
jgi:hypothetical protein